MLFSLRQFVLPAALALATLAPAATASPKKLDWDIQINSRGEVGVQVGTRGIPRHRGQRPTRPITPARGYWQTITEQVWVQGATRQVWVPAAYETLYDSRGRAHCVLIQEGHYRTVQDPGHYETRSRRIWVPARNGITPGRRIR